MSLNLSWLDDFMALVASGNFSRAADERHMTQPAFSRRIRALEEWLGTDLFDRSSQPARPTAAGDWFRGAAQQLLAQAARLPGEARATAEAHSKALRIASTHALSFTFLAGWLRGLEARTAVGPITLVSDVMARCEALLLERQVQFVMSHAHAQAAGGVLARDFSSVRVGADSLVAVSAPDAAGRPTHALTPRSGSLPVPVLDYSAESGIGRILRAVRGAALEQQSCTSVFTAHLASVLRTMALDGRGVAWLPQTLIADDLAVGRLMEAAPPDWRIEMDIRLYRDPSPMGAAAEAFWQATCAAAAAAVPPQRASGTA